MKQVTKPVTIDDILRVKPFVKIQPENLAWIVNPKIAKELEKLSQLKRTKRGKGRNRQN